MNNNDNNNNNLFPCENNMMQNNLIQKSGIETTKESNKENSLSSSIMTTIRKPVIRQIDIVTTANNRHRETVIQLEKKVEVLIKAVNKYKQEIKLLKEERSHNSDGLQLIHSTLSDQEKLIDEQKAEINKLRIQNDNLQQFALEKSNLMEAKFSELKSFCEEVGLNEPYGPVGHIAANLIHLGRGVWLPVDVYNLAIYGITKKTKKQFVRNILVAVFGYDILTESTISGKASNRAEHPMTEIKALDPKKVLAIKDIYKYFLKKELKIPDEAAEMEADSTNTSIGKKIAQIKRIYHKPDKTVSKKILGSEGNADEVELPEKEGDEHQDKIIEDREQHRNEKSTEEVEEYENERCIETADDYGKETIDDEIDIEKELAEIGVGKNESEINFSQY
ncbi:uncharacterized protein LOC127278487 [Leptopilina boulardi]|uniref:uncharacterized protein LOC127278487 n=1 Tax=Leptopilina boulardi TaxID=63433 RepID=UPI0021F5F14D|nr:uncharacterized protein LOC127278487 [Leptopilina boulardi]